MADEPIDPKIIMRLGVAAAANALAIVFFAGGLVMTWLVLPYLMKL